MKKDQQTKAPKTGKDEINLVEVPFAVLSTRSIHNQLEFHDRQNNILRHWLIKGSNEFGLPCATDEDAYICMLYLTKEAGIQERRIYFNQYEFLHLMGCPTTSDYYKRLELSFNRLMEVTIYCDYFWDNGEFKKLLKKEGFHIIDRFILDRGTKGNKKSFFEWNSKIFESLEHGNIKSLNLDFYFSLESGISKKLYRLLDKRTYNKDQITFDLQELCYEKLGLSRNLKYPSLLKQLLGPALEEHQEKKLLSSATYTKTQSGKWLLILKKSTGTETMPEPKPDPVITLSSESTKTVINPLVAQLINLGISKKVSEELVTTISPGIIENQIEALQYRKNIDDKPAFLIKAIQEDYPLPAKLKKKLAQKQAEKEGELKAKYNQYLIAQVDQYLSNSEREKKNW